jgi:RNA polymerase sigma factor (sigma-70 family)
MNKNKAISDIAKQHNSWVNYIRKNSMSESQFKYAEDFVQNFDVKIYDNKKQINKKYVYKTLKSLMIDDLKKVKIKTNNIIKDIMVIDPEIITATHKEAIVIKMHNTIEKMPESDKNIMKLYLYETPSIRGVAKALNNSTRTIRLKITNCKQLIKKEIYDYRQPA